MKCNKCGQIIRDGDNFCQACGTPINNQVAEVSNSKDFSEINQEAKRKIYTYAKNYVKNTLMISIIGTVIIIGFVFLILYLADNGIISTNVSDNSSVLIFVIGVVLVVGLLLIALRLKAQRDVEGKGRFFTVINTNFNDTNLLDSKLKEVLTNLGYKLINYKNEQVYFSKVFGNAILGSSGFPRYIKYQIKDNKIEIEAWVIIWGQEFSLEGQSGYLIKEKLRADLESIMNLFENV